MAYLDYTRELSGSIPNLADSLAANLVNRAWQELRDSRKWSWLVGEGTFFVPPLINSGLVSVTQFSTQVVANVTAAPLFAAALSATPPLTQRQFRTSTTIYNITAYNSATNTLTLDRPYYEPTNVATSFQVYQCYYPTPSTDFLKFLSVLNPTVGYTLGQRRLNLTKEEIDRRDPQRGAFGDPHCAAFYRTDPVSQCPVYEFWEHPTNSYQLPFIYQRRGLDLVNDTDALPTTIPYYSFMELVHYHGCMWAAKNVGRYPDLRGVNWLNVAFGHLKVYETWLQKAKVQDDEIYLRNWVIPYNTESGLIGPLDARFAQSHDMTADY